MTNLNDFNNMRYKWVSDWYRLWAMNNFWFPRNQSPHGYEGLSLLDEAGTDCLRQILSFLVFLDSLQKQQSAHYQQYITANEVNLCLHIQAFRNVCTVRVTAICSIQSVVRRNAMTFFYQWKRMSIY